MPGEQHLPRRGELAARFGLAYACVMALRLVAGMLVELTYRPASGDYAGVVTVPQPYPREPMVMPFSRLKPPKWGLPGGATSPEAYDELAVLAVPVAMKASGQKPSASQKKALLEASAKRVRKPRQPSP